jgi:YD repeat-containing protein
VQSRLTFSTAGKLTSFVDRNGLTTSGSYNGSGHLSTVTDPGGRTLTFTTNGTTGRITEISSQLTSSPNSYRTVAFEYTNDDLTEVTDVKGGTTTYAYSSHRLTSLTDSNNHTANTNVYDAASRVAKQTDAVSGKTCVYYGSGPTNPETTDCPGVTPAPAAGQTIVVDPRGKKTTYDFDTKFRVTSITDHDGNVTSYTYDTSNNRTCVVDPLSHRTAYTYDSKGNVTSVIDANNTDTNCALASGGVKWTYVYNARNDVELETDPLGRRTIYVYDGNGN